MVVDALEWNWQQFCAWIHSAVRSLCTEPAHTKRDKLNSRNELEHTVKLCARRVFGGHSRHVWRKWSDNQMKSFNHHSSSMSWYLKAKKITPPLSLTLCLSVSLCSYNKLIKFHLIWVRLMLFSIFIVLQHSIWLTFFQHGAVDGTRCVTVVGRCVQLETQ